MSRGIFSAAWRFYEARLVPKDASPTYRGDIYAAFYSGALVVLECVKVDIGLPDDDALTNLQLLDDEVRSFSDEHCHAWDDAAQ